MVLVSRLEQSHLFGLNLQLRIISLHFLGCLVAILEVHFHVQHVHPHLPLQALLDGTLLYLVNIELFRVHLSDSILGHSIVDEQYHIFSQVRDALYDSLVFVDGSHLLFPLLIGLEPRLILSLDPERTTRGLLSRNGGIELQVQGDVGIGSSERGVGLWIELILQVDDLGIYDLLDPTLQHPILV